MTEKKTEERLRKRVKYEAPQVWCFPMEMECGIMAGSDTVGFNGNIGGGSGGGGGNNTIDRQTNDNFFSSSNVNIGTGTIGGQGNASGGSWGTSGQTNDDF